MEAEGGGPGVAPLTARSVLLSVLLGTHPPELPVSALVRTAELFGISEGTARVALSRLVAEGDVTAENGRYSLTQRLVERQRRQDDARSPATRPWRGTWELAAAPPATAGAELSSLRTSLTKLRLAELRSGIWARPANLQRSWPPELSAAVMRFDAKPWSTETAKRLAAGLWDLAGWAERAKALLAALNDSAAADVRFSLAAAIVRHLETDPLLPAPLLPRGWPGDRLRRAYAAYERELAALLMAARGRSGPEASALQRAR